MKIGPEEIAVGLVAVMENEVVDRLARSSFRVNTAQVMKRRPFVCIAVDDDVSWWTALTSSPGRTYARRGLPEKYRVDGCEQWRHGPLYISDGAFVYECTSAIIAEASANERTVPANRAALLPSGVRLVVEEVRLQSNRRTSAMAIPGVDSREVVA